MNKLTHKQNDDLAYAYYLIQSIKQDLEDSYGEPKRGFKQIWKDIDSVLSKLENIR